MIVDYYVQTRKTGGESDDSVAITARSLEALSRLAEASARIRLSPLATAADAERAIRLTKTWRHELMGEHFDLTTIESGKKGKVRNQEKQLIDIVSVLQNDSGTAANLLDVLTEAERRDIPPQQSGRHHRQVVQGRTDDAPIGLRHASNRLRAVQGLCS